MIDIDKKYIPLGILLLTTFIVAVVYYISYHNLEFFASKDNKKKDHNKKDHNKKEHNKKEHKKTDTKKLALPYIVTSPIEWAKIKGLLAGQTEREESIHDIKTKDGKIAKIKRVYSKNKYTITNYEIKKGNKVIYRYIPPPPLPSSTLTAPPPLPPVPQRPSNTPEVVPLRPCTVWFTKYKDECNAGLFNKDIDVLREMRNSLVTNEWNTFKEKEQLFKTSEAFINKYKPYYYITMKNNNPATAIVNTNVTANPALYDTFKNEQEKKLQKIKEAMTLMETNTLNYQYNTEYIQLAKNLKAIQQNSNKQAYISTGSQLQAQIRKLPTLQKAMKDAYDKLNKKIIKTPDFFKYDKVIKEREENAKLGNNAADRCKVDYNGWYELDSKTNPHFSDHVKDITDPELEKLGDPSTWAECYKINNTLNDWSKFQAEYENKRTNYSDITVSFDPVDIGKGKSIKLLNTDGTITDVNSSGPYINKITINNFNAADSAECDDILFKPNYPLIENGLVEIKLEPGESDKIVDIRKIGFTNDSRYIQTSSTLDQIDKRSLLEVFYDYGIELYPTPIFYLRPTKNIQYTVKNLYTDPKCNRFFSNTDKNGYIKQSYEGITATPSLKAYMANSKSYKNANYPAIIPSVNEKAIRKDVPVFFTDFSRIDIVNYTNNDIIELFRDLILSILNKHKYNSALSKTLSGIKTNIPDLIPFTWSTFTKNPQMVAYTVSKQIRTDANNRRTSTYVVDNQNIGFQGSGLLQAIRDNLKKNTTYLAGIIGTVNSKIKSIETSLNVTVDTLDVEINKIKNVRDTNHTKYITNLKTKVDASRVKMNDPTLTSVQKKQAEKAYNETSITYGKGINKQYADYTKWDPSINARENKKKYQIQATVKTINNLTEDVNRMKRYIEKANSYINGIEAVLVDIEQKLFNTDILPSILRSYINKPITKLLPYYSKSYKSTTNTIYLAISRINPTNTTIPPKLFYIPSTGRPATQVSEMATKPLKSMLNVRDSYIPYSTANVVNQQLVSNINNQITGSRIINEPFESEPWKVALLDGERQPLYYISTIGNFNMYTTPYYGRVEYLLLKPGIKVTLKNERNFTNEFTNSGLATAEKLIMLNSTMTGKLCDAYDSRRCVLTEIMIQQI